jgi:hypothetical protein
MDRAYDCSHVVDIADEPRHHLVLANEYVRAFAVEIPPHVRTLCHQHPQDYLLYSASGSEIISAARDEEPKRLSYRDGECELLSAGLVHVVDNIGENSVRNVVVELLPRAGALRRGAGPSRVSAETYAVQIFDKTSTDELLVEDRAAIVLVKVEPGAEVEISGPAVVATPYGNKLNPDAIGDVEVKSHSVCDLAWIPPGGTVILWGCWEQTESAIVFQIGRTDEQGFAVSHVRSPLRSLQAHAEPE